ncbi:clarin-2-like isoform X2 [Tachypleus tridentatus]|uniref:clarin-2-like isoform X2 n=1 Tax=Tachypleus tridentatus TaxID=6853 RepID=UPI003FD47816
MDSVKRALTFSTVVLCCGCLAFLAASLGTEKWVNAVPLREGYAVNISDIDQEGRYKGTINVGLFSGYKKLDPGAGARENELKITDERQKYPSFFSFGLWIMTITFLVMALLFGLLGTIFGVLNTVTTPVELITGMLGLYVWNILGVIASLMTIIMWAALFHTALINNIMTQEELEEGWTSKDKAYLSKSFWYVLIALFFYFINIVLVHLAITQPWERRKPKAVPDQNPNGVIMLY